MINNLFNLQRVKGARAESGYTQEQVANYLKLSNVSYSLKESGKRPFTIDELCLISDMFNKNISYFFTIKVI